MKKTLLSLSALAVLVVPSFAAEKDIVDIAAGNKDFSTLVSLVKAAGLVDTLKGKGPFTVLAPTNAAFAKVPKAVLEKLGADKALLTKVLTYHVIAGEVYAKDLKNGITPKTVEGETVKVTIKGKTVKFNQAKVVIADVKASNGVIHAIDAVILPASITKMLAGK
jgi:uncharacterized surface protein with fasciclin (FAS1) repeats